MIRLARLFRCESGASAVELVLCLPFLMALIFGGFEAGNYVLTEHKVVKGVRDGARYAARLDFSNYDCGTPAINATAADQIRAVTRTGQADGAGKVRINGWGDDDVFVSLSCAPNTSTGLSGIYSDMETAPRVLVSTVVPYPSILGLLGFDTSDAVVRAQAQAAVMGL